MTVTKKHINYQHIKNTISDMQNMRMPGAFDIVCKYPSLSVKNLELVFEINRQTKVNKWNNTIIGSTFIHCHFDAYRKCIELSNHIPCESWCDAVVN